MNDRPDNRFAVLWVNNRTGQFQGWTGLRWSPYPKHWLYMRQALAESLLGPTAANMGFGGHPELYERPAPPEEVVEPSE